MSDMTMDDPAIQPPRLMDAPYGINPATGQPLPAPRPSPGDMIGSPGDPNTHVNMGPMPSWDQYAPTDSWDYNMNFDTPQFRSSLDTSNLTPLNTDFSGLAKSGADAAYKGASQYFDTDFGRERDATQQRLANMGLVPGSEAYNEEMDRMERGQNSARENAAFQAQGVGFDQAQRAFLQALQSRQQQVSEQGLDANMGLGAANLAMQGRLGLRGQNLSARGQDIGAATSRYGTDIGALLQRYGIDVGANTSRYGSDNSLRAAVQGAAASTRNAELGSATSRYGMDINGELGRRQLGLSGDQQDFNQLMALISMGRGGVNMPNFGSPNPLDVTGAYGIANQANRNSMDYGAANNAGLYGLGATLLGGLFRNGGY